MWNGTFSPYLVKHRDYCGDITRHLFRVTPEGTPITSKDVWSDADGNDVIYIKFREGHGKVTTEIYEYPVPPAVISRWQAGGSEKDLLQWIHDHTNANSTADSDREFSVDDL